MELLQQILAAFQGIPPAAIIIFLIVSVVIAVELWRLRPQRERPPVPPPPDLPAQAGAPPSPPLGQEQTAIPAQPGEFKPLTTRQIAALAVLLLVVVAIPAGVLLYQKVRSPLPPGGTPMPIIKPPTKTPPASSSPTATLRPTRTPRATATPFPTKAPLITPSAQPTSKGGRQQTASPSGLPAQAGLPTQTGLPQYRKPGELPDAGTPIFLIPLLGGGGLFLIGLKKFLEKART